MRAVCVTLILLAAAGASAPAQDGDRVQISLERTACFGKCPDYVVTLGWDGTVHYEGRQFVRVRGARTWKIDPAVVYALARDMEKAGFFEWNDEYTALITDLATTYTTLSVGPRTKKIKDYYGAPPALKEFEARIDRVSEVRGYVTIDAAAIQEMRSKGWRPTGDAARSWMDDALYAGDASTVKALLAAGMNARAVDQNGVTLVMKAAVSGDPDTVRAVIAGGGDPGARDKAGRNAADRARDGIAGGRGAKTACLVKFTGRPCDYNAILRLFTDQ
jgi:hypothetical protein